MQSRKDSLSDAKNSLMEDKIKKLEEVCLSKMTSIEQKLDLLLTERKANLSLPKSKSMELVTKEKEISILEEKVKDYKEAIEKQSETIRTQEVKINDKEYLIRRKDETIENLRYLRNLEEAREDITGFLKKDSQDGIKRFPGEFKRVLDKLNLDKKSTNDPPNFSDLDEAEKKIYDISCDLIFFSNIYVRYYSTRLDNTTTNSSEGIVNVNTKILALEKEYCPADQLTNRRSLYDSLIKFNENIDHTFFKGHKKDVNEMEDLIFLPHEEQRCIIL